MDDAVVEIYAAADALQAYDLKNVLAAAGIEALVVGDHLQAAAGDLPLGPAIAPRVWVRREDEGAAREVTASWEAELRGEAPPPAGAPWRCAGCGEENESNFSVCWNCETPRPPDPPPA